jgi:transcriptional regulator with XRE-family HTH domain
MPREKQLEMTAADRLRWVREALGLSRSEFADLIGTSYYRIVNIERGVQRPQQDITVAVARLFRIDANWLLTSDGPWPELRPLDIDREAIRQHGERAKSEAMQSAFREQAKRILERAA